MLFELIFDDFYQPTNANAIAVVVLLKAYVGCNNSLDPSYPVLIGKLNTDVVY